MTTTKPTIALCVIAKDKAAVITRMLESTKGVFDLYVLQDTGSLDNTVELWEEWCKKNNKEFKTSKKQLGVDYDYVVVQGRETLAEFDKAREDSFQMARDAGVDYAFWLDTDDELLGAERVPLLAQEATANSLAGVLLGYDYAPGTHQARERLIDLRISGRWLYPVHENYNFDTPNIRQSIFPFENWGVKVVHRRSLHEAADSGIAPARERRNNQIMMRYIEKHGVENTPDKTINDLAYDHWEYQEWNDAIKWYEIALQRDSYMQAPEIRLNIHTRLARAYSAVSEYAKAISSGYECLRSAPQVADGHLIIAENLAIIGDWSSADYHASRVLEMGVPKVTGAVNQLEYTVTPLRIKQQAALAANKLDDAINIAKELVRIMPQNGEFRSTLKNLKHLQKKSGATQGLIKLTTYYQDTNKYKNFDRLIDAIPIELREDPTVRTLIKELKYDFKRKTIKTELSGSKSIVFYAGAHYEPWDGNSDSGKGIGGSEGMCIQLARGLAALGNKVFVYNECAEEKLIDGVQYVHHSKWDPSTKCDIFVSLRKPELFGSYHSTTQMINATKQYLWLHDTSYGELPPVAFSGPNKTIILSEAHKRVIKAEHELDDDSIFWMTRNALNKAAIEYADENAKERNPYRVIYGSSYDRGLLNLLKMWPKIKEAVPEAELNILYGWDTYDAIMNSRLANPATAAYGQQMRAYKSEVIDLISKLPDVYELGRVSQNELYKRFKESAVWVYPTEFYEISCITAMTAHAMGAVPICTPVGALEETVNNKYSYKTTLDKIPDATIYALTHPEEAEKKRAAGMEWARQQFDIDTLAKEWDLFFNND